MTCLEVLEKFYLHLVQVIFAVAVARVRDRRKQK